MINKVKKIVGNNRVILENFSFLSMLQISNLIIFFLLIPYLFRVLGKENYGIVVFAQTVAAYFAILVNFGSNATATRDISVNRDNHDLRSTIISSVLVLKSTFFIVSFITLLVLSWFVPFVKDHRLVFLFSMLYCLSEALFPIWYFQGIEKMRYITYINVSTRLLSAVLIFSFVKHQEDYYIVPLFLGSGTVTGAIIGLAIIFMSPENRFKYIDFNGLKEMISYNLPLFFSNAASQIYVNANRLVIGSYLGMQDLAIYDIAERLVTILKVPLTVVGQVLFPKISKDKDLKYSKRVMFMVLIFYLIIYFTLYFSGDLLIRLFSGSTTPEALWILRILALSIIPISVGLFYSDLLLVPFGFIKEYAKMRASTLAIYVIAILFLFAMSRVSLINLSIVVVLVEICVLSYSYNLARKNGLTSKSGINYGSIVERQ